jgi:hypothetical protein
MHLPQKVKRPRPPRNRHGGHEDTKRMGSGPGSCVSFRGHLSVCFEAPVGQCVFLWLSTSESGNRPERRAQPFAPYCKSRGRRCRPLRGYNRALRLATHQASALFAWLGRTAVHAGTAPRPATRSGGDQHQTRAWLRVDVAPSTCEVPAHKGLHPSRATEPPFDWHPVVLQDPTPGPDEV